MNKLLVICPFKSKKNKVLLDRNSRKRQFKIHFVKGGILEAIKEYRGLSKKFPDSDLLITKDTQFFIESPFSLPTPLPKYKMLFLNGDIVELGDNHSIEIDRYYQRAFVKESGCFIISKDFVNEFAKELRETGNLKTSDLKDSYYLKSTYVVDNEKAEGLEEIKTPKFLDFVQRTSDGLEIVSALSTEGSSDTRSPLELKFEETTPESDLPNVTLITPITSKTEEEKALFYLTVLQFYKMKYPRDKLEWIIVDDTPEEFQTKITDFLPSKVPDPRIKCIKCSVTGDSTYVSVSLGKKLNVACNYASSDILMHFFEKTYYSEHSVFHRVNYLMSSGKGVIGSTKIGNYNIRTNFSSTKQEFDRKGHQIIIQEPSMCFTKVFWKTKPFHEYLQNDNHQNIVNIPFLHKRYNLALDIPFLFTCTGIETHTNKIKEREMTSSADLAETFPDYIKDSLKIWISEYVSPSTPHTR